MKLFNILTTRRRIRRKIDELLTDYRRAGNLIAHQIVPEGLWTVLQFTGGDDKGKKIITFDLIEERGTSWGGEKGMTYVKSMDETVGPCYYDCPLWFLERATDFSNDSYSAGWRGKVREYWKVKEPKNYSGFQVNSGRLEFNDSRDDEDSHSDADPGL